ncbi:Ferredoxin-NADP reductase [Amphibacillus marinus]|uniref:Ferredoxin-NADP reductase n=1 Tax=Amphibacillus marinus TaxID=872970 RepID=A0A1H8KJC3_9BACI|nr:FAD-dependent oxidoreductase [Amphibacillus marinus]SEN92771.1 Ferredoxin-NADP reductase [Amphibacillus marinus]
MSFFKDMIAVFKKKELTFLSSSKESEGVYTFSFEKPSDLTWQAGQYGLFTITHKKIKNSTKPFSIASAPTENVINITTMVKEQPSAFKQALLDLKPGDTIKMGGPVGAFALNQQDATLWIAGGIGITPYRAMLKQLEQAIGQPAQPIELLYLDSEQGYLFKDQLTELESKQIIKVKYLKTREQLHQEIDSFIAKHQNTGSYFLAGPGGLVKSVAEYLQSQDIAKRQINKDSFYGY